MAWRRFAEPNPAICVGTSAGPGTCERYVFDELYLDGAHRKAPHLAKVPELADRTAWVLEAMEVS